MKLLPRQLRTERYCYSSDKSVDQLTNDLIKVFKNNQLFRQELTGKFVGKNDFLLSYKYSFDLEQISLYFYTRLQGNIRNQNDKTILDIVIKPHLLVRNFFFAYLILGLILLITILTNILNATTETIIATVTCAFILPFATAFYGQIAKDNLRNKFVKTFGLEEKSCL